MASQKRVRSLSDSSSDDDSSGRPSFASPPKRRNRTDEFQTPPRSTVIVSPVKQSGIGMPGIICATSSSQDTSDDSSDEDGRVMPNVHKNFIKPKAAPAPVIDQKAKNMMAKMGFKEGAGLGKNQQGRVKPVEVSKQRGRRGLGMQIPGLEAEEVEWDSGNEVIEVEEKVTWFPSHDMRCPEISEMMAWLKEGAKKLTIDDETQFCQPDLLQQVLQCKTIFDRLDDEELRRARTRSNPFETIRGAFFLNRAAMKMANLDAIFNFMFTDPKEENGSSSVGDLLYFADVCAGPGGFSEYVLWRKKWEAKGFGFTLKESNDFKLEDFFAAPSESFETHYGVGGVNGNGNVYFPENIREFQRHVLSQTDGQGVHFMMADGGFSVEGQENIQEILSKQLYLCQFLVALCIVRIGGHFVCKLFDVFTPFSAGLIYLMYRAFKHVSIHKPNTSRPANSERYIICKWKRDDTKDIEDYFFNVNDRLTVLGKATSKADVLEVVPLEMLTEDQNFYEYLVVSNNNLAMRQVVNLAKIAAFCKDVSLREDRQAELKKQSLEFWKIPDKARTAPARMSPQDKAKELMGNNPSALNVKAKIISDLIALRDSVKSVYDWRCVVLALESENPMQTYYLGLGRNNVFRWDPTRSRWNKVLENIEMARDSLIYAELVQELRGEGRSQKRSHSLHIIDAVCLGGVDVSQLHIKERFERCRKFAKSMNKTTRTDLVTIRAKEHFKMEEVDHIFQRLAPRLIKNSGFQERLVFCVQDDDQRAFLPSGLLLYKATKSPWMMTVSKSSGRKYWYNSMNRKSIYECPRDSISSFFECHNSRLFWSWRKSSDDDCELEKEDFISFVHDMCTK